MLHVVILGQKSAAIAEGSVKAWLLFSLLLLPVVVSFYLTFNCITPKRYEWILSKSFG